MNGARYDQPQVINTLPRQPFTKRIFPQDSSKTSKLQEKSPPACIHLRLIKEEIKS